MRKEKKFLELRDHSTIYYEKSGHGKPVIFIHGNGGSGKIFYLVIQILEKYFECINIDCRGQGKSKNTSDKLNFEMMSDDIIEILDAENITKASIIGFSDGANVAMFLGSHHTKRVDKLILNAGNVLYSGIKKYYHLLDHVHLLFSRLFHYKELVINLMMHDTGLKMEELREIQNDSLVLVGQFDMIKRSHSQKIADFIPRGILEVIPLAFHIYLLYNPWGFAKRCKLFLER